MTIEEEFRQYKIDIERIRLKQARKTAVVLAIVLCLLMISFIYALTQRTEAIRQREIMLQMKEQSLQQVVELNHKLADCESKN